MILGIEIIGNKQRSDAISIFESFGIPLGEGDRFLPVFIDYLDEFDIYYLAKSYGCWIKEEPLLPSVFNSRLPYGMENLFIRSGSIESISSVDLRRLSDLGVQYAIDLRVRRINEESENLLKNECIKYISLPLEPTWISPSEGRLDCLQGIESTYQSYRDFLIKDLNQIEQAIGIVLKSKSLVFCSHGKDRTGLLSALIEEEAGSDIDSILVDYTMSYWNVAMRFAMEMKADITSHFDKIVSPSRLNKLLFEPNR